MNSKLTQNEVGTFLIQKYADHFIFLVDGGLNEDVLWSICSKSCDNGTSFRHLTCTKPQPFNGGKPCLGNRTRAKDCNQVPCPSNSSYDKYSYNQALA